MALEMLVDVSYALMLPQAHGTVSVALPQEYSSECHLFIPREAVILPHLYILTRIIPIDTVRLNRGYVNGINRHTHRVILDSKC